MMSIRGGRSLLSYGHASRIRLKGIPVAWRQIPKPAFLTIDFCNRFCRPAPRAVAVGKLSEVGTQVRLHYLVNRAKDGVRHKAVEFLERTKRLDLDFVA